MEVSQSKYEKGGACSSYGNRRGVFRVWLENLRERDHLEVMCIDGRIISNGS